MCVCVCVRVCVCVCSNIFSETTGPTEAKFHVEPPWDRGRKFIKMVQAGVQVICCCSLLSTSRWAGSFSRDFTINLSPQCRAFSRALKFKKLKALLLLRPVGAGTTNDWCIKHLSFQCQTTVSLNLIPRVEIVRNKSSILIV